MRSVGLRAAMALPVAAMVLAAAPVRAQPADPGPGGLGIRLLDAPVSLAADPRAHEYIIDHLHPGDTIVRHIAVTNSTSGPLHVELYPAAAEIARGSFVIAQGHTLNELTTWVKVSPSAANLPAGVTLTVTATIVVPPDASSGERYGAVVAELPPVKGAGGFSVASRVGIRLYLAVGPGGGPSSDFRISQLVARRLSDGRPAVEAEVRNTGGRALDMHGTLRLDHGPGALSAGPFPALLGTTLAPGQTEPVLIPLDRALPPGPWHARVDLQSGLIRRAADGMITFPTALDARAQPVPARAVPLTRDRGVLVPVALGLIVLLLVALGWWWVLARRRTPDKEDQQASGAEKEHR